MLLTALPPAPPTPITTIRGFNSVICGAFKLMVIVGSPLPEGSNAFEWSISVDGGLLNGFLFHN